jgi:hypothetical protein
MLSRRPRSLSTACLCLIELSPVECDSIAKSPKATEEGDLRFVRYRALDDRGHLLGREDLDGVAHLDIGKAFEGETTLNAVLDLGDVVFKAP